VAVNARLKKLIKRIGEHEAYYLELFEELLKKEKQKK